MQEQTPYYLNYYATEYRVYSKDVCLQRIAFQQPLYADNFGCGLDR